jgi:two-component system sensor histidine kinase ChvG
MFSLRWKLIAAFLLVVFIPCWFLHRYAIGFFDRYTRRALEDEMVAYAYLLGEQYRSLVLEEPEESRPDAFGAFERLIKTCGPEMQTRIRIVSPEGEVLADSHDDSTVGQNFSDRPELRQALTGKYGSRAALTDDRQYMYYYIAFPILSAAAPPQAIVYISRHTGPIIHALKEMRYYQRRGMVVALLTALAVAVFLAFTITIRLRRLTRAARDAAAGDGPLEAAIRGHDEIGELSASLAHMSEEVVKRSRYNRDFLSETMHELKTPLTAIKGAAEILEGSAGEKTETRNKFLANIRYETERLIRMAGELSQLTKLDADVLSEPKETVDYLDFLRGFVERLRPTLESHQAAFQVIIPEGKFCVSILPGRIEQVIANLLENAFRYTAPEGSVTLSVSPGAEKTVVTTVADTGVGIPLAVQDKVFDRFFTTERRQNHPGYGSGLGLAIAKSIVEHHGGKIRVQSEPGQGASFSFSLKLVS